MPVIADANSMTYVLHKALGDDIVIDRGGRPRAAAPGGGAGRQHLPGRAADVGGEFPARCFPSRRAIGSCWSTPPAERAAAVAAAIERAAGDLGADAVLDGRAAGGVPRVENTYLSTFQTLGGLGLLVGTVGLAAVLLRNVLERRRELALLGAVGYAAATCSRSSWPRTLLLLGWGLAVGALCALVAIAPAVLERGGAAAARRPAAGCCWLRSSRRGCYRRSSRRGRRCARRCSRRCGRNRTVASRP